MNVPAGRAPSAAPTLLDAVAPDARALILRECKTRRCAKGEQVVRAQSSDDNFYLIARGKVRVTLFSRDGREVSFITLAPGDNFGELALIDGQPRSSDVIALSETELIVMPPDTFRRMVREHPAVAHQLLRQLTSVIRRLSERVFEYSTIGVNNRIHAEVLRLARAGLDLDGVARIDNPPTHAQLASRVSCHREAVSRELKSLENRGVVHKKNRKWIIQDIDALQELVDHAVGRE